MSVDCKQKSVYVVLSQTGTLPSKMIKAVTQDQYCHSSISLTKDLKPMYSFSRKHPYNPFWAGLMREFPGMGTLKRFPNTKILIMDINITHEQFDGIRQTIEDMFREQEKYHYNCIGLFKGALNIEQAPRQYHYYCSEFVRYVLKKNGIPGSEKLPNIVHPIDFLAMPYKVIYQGKLCDYDANQVESRHYSFRTK